MRPSSGHGSERGGKKPLEEGSRPGEQGDRADPDWVVGGPVEGPPSEPIQRVEWELQRLPSRLPPWLRTLASLVANARNIYGCFMVLSILAAGLFFVTRQILTDRPVNPAQGNVAPEATLPLLGEEELREAERRRETIYQQGDIEACSEFKGKLYQEQTLAGTATTELYWSCVYNLSLSFKDRELCLTLSDDYSKRICLQALSVSFQDPDLCQEADEYAREEVAGEENSLASTDYCYFSLGTCERIRDVVNREGCFWHRARDAGALAMPLCRSFTSEWRNRCVASVAVVENSPEICQEATDVDYCYFDAVRITGPNLGLEQTLDVKAWCERISPLRIQLRLACLSGD